MLKQPRPQTTETPVAETQATESAAEAGPAEAIERALASARARVDAANADLAAAYESAAASTNAKSRDRAADRLSGPTGGLNTAPPTASSNEPPRVAAPSALASAAPSLADDAAPSVSAEETPPNALATLNAPRRDEARPSAEADEVAETAGAPIADDDSTDQRAADAANAAPEDDDAIAEDAIAEGAIAADVADDAQTEAAAADEDGVSDEAVFDFALATTAPPTEAQRPARKGLGGPLAGALNDVAYAPIAVVALLKEKAASGDADALFELGRRLRSGDEVTRDRGAAYALWREAALKGHAPAATALANLAGALDKNELTRAESVADDIREDPETLMALAKPIEPAEKSPPPTVSVEEEGGEENVGPIEAIMRLFR